MRHAHQNPRRHPVLKAILAVLLALILLLAGSIAFILYGPNTELRDLYVTTFLQTSAMKFMATAFLPEATIQEILENNRVIPPSEASDPSKVQIAGRETATPVT